MKHTETFPSAHDIDLVQVLCSEAGVHLTDDATSILLMHLDLVLKHNEFVNLTAVKSRAEALRLHVVDSLCISPVVSALSGCDAKLLDLGTGAGYPGIPVSVAAAMDCVLMDSVRKKTDFLSIAVAELGLGESVSVINARAEDLAKSGDFLVSGVLARAVAALPVLVELASPLLQLHGLLYCMKAQVDPAEEESGNRAAALCGMAPEMRSDYTLPGGSERRSLIVYRKLEATPASLPRRAGIAQKRPLGIR